MRCTSPSIVSLGSHTSGAFPLDPILSLYSLSVCIRGCIYTAVYSWCVCVSGAQVSLHVGVKWRVCWSWVSLETCAVQRSNGWERGRGRVGRGRGRVGGGSGSSDVIGSGGGTHLGVRSPSWLPWLQLRQVFLTYAIGMTLTSPDERERER